MEYFDSRGLRGFNVGGGDLTRCCCFVAYCSCRLYGTQVQRPRIPSSKAAAGGLGPLDDGGCLLAGNELVTTWRFGETYC